LEIRSGEENSIRNCQLDIKLKDHEVQKRWKRPNASPGNLKLRVAKRVNKAMRQRKKTLQRRELEDKPHGE
jgi:hypothetical protein